MNYNSILENIITEKRKRKRKIPKRYLTRDPASMRDEIRKHAHKKDSDPTAYKSHPEGDWKADYSKSGKRWKTRKSKYTSAFKKRFGENLDIDLKSVIGESKLSVLAEILLIEAISEKTKKAVRNKAKKANAPVGPLMSVLRRGMAAWKTGHRPGVNQIQWALGRVNSFLVGGNARKVDKDLWEKVKTWRKKKRKSKK
jgi:hypothetical protein